MKKPIEEITLTKKIFGLEYLSAGLLYGLGIFLITPASDDPMIKFVGVGSLMAVLAVMLIRLSLNHQERMDERARRNLDRASTITLRIVCLLLLILVIGLQFITFSPSAISATIAFLLAIALCVHAFSFKKIEEVGE